MLSEAEVSAEESLLRRNFREISRRFASLEMTYLLPDLLVKDQERGNEKRDERLPIVKVKGHD